MSKFLRGDIVTPVVGQKYRSGQVILTWSSHISVRTGMPLVEVMLDKDNEIAYFDEDELELVEHEYEYAAVRVDLEDFEQFFLGGTYYDPECWGTLEEAEKLIKEAQNDKHYDEWKEDTQLQINRRRKAGPTIGHKTFKW